MPVHTRAYVTQNPLRSGKGAGPGAQGPPIRILYGGVPRDEVCSNIERKADPAPMGKMWGNLQQIDFFS